MLKYKCYKFSIGVVEIKCFILGIKNFKLNIDIEWGWK
jgi:hypothetical protein